MTRRALLGALCCSVALGAAGIGSAVALQDRQPAPAGGAQPAHAQGHASALDRDPAVGPPPEARTTATVPPVVPAPRAATTVAPPAPTVRRSTPAAPAPAAVGSSTTVRRPSSTSHPSTTSTTRDPLDPVAPPILVPVEGGTYPIPVANVLGCAVSPSSIDVAYGEHVTVHVTYATGYHPGTAVMMSNEWDRFYSSTDATGRGADFQVVIHEPYPDGNGGTEPAGTPYLLYPNHPSGARMNCSLRVTPH